MIGFYLSLLLYNLLGLLAILIAWPYLVYKCLVGSQRWRQRLGDVPWNRTPAVWIHAASLGEVSMIRPLLYQIKMLLPNRRICLSTMTATGQRKAKEIVDNWGISFYFPLDIIPLQLNALARLRPSLLILCETELWPNLIWLCRQKGIPVFLVNARLSSKSFPYYRAFGLLFKPLLRSMSLIACQTQRDLERYRALVGTEGNIVLAGNMKYDAISEPPSPGERKSIRRSLGLKEGDLVLVAGSTREREEEILLEAWQGVREKSRYKVRDFKLIIAPRHPDRFEKVAEILEESGLEFARRSRQGDFSLWQIMLWDTIGELTKAYAAGDMAFVGGSLVPVGGHNPLEPAALGLPVVFGPHMENARESAEMLIKAGGAIEVCSAEELCQIIIDWLANDDKRRRMGMSALRVVDTQRGAARFTAGSIIEKLGDQNKDRASRNQTI